MIRFILMFIAIVACLTAYFVIDRKYDRPPIDKIYSTRQGINEITLVQKPEDINGKFSLSRAICSVFTKVNYMNESFYYLGSGASISIPNKSGYSRYIATEVISPNDSTRWPQKNVLSIVDSSNNELLGRREIWYRGSFDRDHYSERGYLGSVSASFVKKILNPDYNAGVTGCQVDYPRTVFSTKEVKLERKIAVDHFINKNKTCSNMERKSYPSKHHSPRASFANWTYKPHRFIDEVYCSNNSVFIFSEGTLFDRNLLVDWLSIKGKLLGQFEIKYEKEDYQYRFFSILSATVDGNKIYIQRLMTNTSKRGEFISDGVISHITIDINKSEKRTKWCKNIGEVRNYSCAEFVEAPNPSS
jgi:hypothetical protein